MVDIAQTKELIKKQLDKHSILLYMKGTPNEPQCGFSAQVVEILMDSNIRFAFVNILDHGDIRHVLPKYADWPTFPQLWVNKELIGGCDIVSDMHSRGELIPVLTKYQSGETPSK